MFHTFDNWCARQLPHSLQRKIRHFYEYLWDSGQDKHSTGLFDEMPDKLKLQLNVALKRSLIEKVSDTQDDCNQPRGMRRDAVE